MVEIHLIEEQNNKQNKWKVVFMFYHTIRLAAMFDVFYTGKI